MEDIKKEISIFNEQLKNLRWDKLQIEQILPEIKKDIWIILSSIKTTSITKENKIHLANLLLQNIDLEKWKLYGNMTTFIKSKPYIQILNELKESIISNINELDDIQKIETEAVNHIDKPKEYKKNEAEDWNINLFDELEEYLQLDIEFSEISEDNREELFDDYKSYIEDINIERSEKINQIISLQSKKTKWRYYEFISAVNQLVEWHLQKDIELLKKEENLKKINELQKNNKKRLWEIKLLEDIIIPKHKSYKQSINNKLESFIWAKNNNIDADQKIESILQSLNWIFSDIYNTTEEREKYLKLNMYNKYTIWNMEEYFKMIYKEIENIKKADTTGLWFIKKFPKFKDTINNIVYDFLKEILDKKEDIEEAYKDTEEHIKNLE